MGALLALGLVWTALAHSSSPRCGVPAQGRRSGQPRAENGIALAWWLFGEAPSAREWIGGALIVGVSVWLTWLRGPEALSDGWHGGACSPDCARGDRYRGVAAPRRAGVQVCDLFRCFVVSPVGGDWSGFAPAQAGVQCL